MPIFFLSGALFPLAGLPKVVDLITKVNPLTYGIDGIRGALIGVSQMSMLIDFGIVFGITVVIAIVGSYAFSKIEV